MKVGEAHELVAHVEQDIAAEQNPDLRAWYGQEFELDPDLVTARRAMENIGVMAGQLGQLASLKSLEALRGQAETEEPIEPDLDMEIPPVLTPEELLHEQIERKYASSLNTYETEMDRIAATITKRSKREHQERMALRQFARDFVDFKDVTGDDHIVLQSKALGWAITELIEEPDLIDAIVDSSVDYAERHGKEVTDNPENFAAIIVGSLPGQPSEADFERILRSIFSTRHNTDDFPAINVNLAKSVFELMTNRDALEKIVRIDALEEPYMPSIYVEKAVQSSMEAYAAKNMAEFAELTQASVVMAMLRIDLGKEAASLDSKVVSAVASASGANASLFEHLSDRELDQFKALIFNTRSGDPVAVKRLGTDEYVDLDTKPNDFEELFKLSPLYAKRMQHFSPNFYGLKAAQNILGSPNVLGMSVPLSPTLSVEVFAPYTPDSSVAPRSEIHHAIVDYMRGNSEVFLDIAGQGSAELGVRSYRETGELQMVYRPIYPEDEKEGIILFRPSVQSDLRYYPSLQQLALNFHRGHAGVAESDWYRQENEALREEIRAGQRRFLGRRPIKFAMLEDIQETGLRSVKLRYDPKTRSVLADFLVDDGEVQVTLDRNFEVDMNEGFAAAAPVMKRYYENLVLKLVKKWACSREVHTSEGTVSDTTGNAANMGHFAYLRIRDGQRYKFSEQQRRACLEEQGTDLALENERLRVLDETGQDRNSTYVREAYDPTKPPLEVYYQSLS